MAVGDVVSGIASVANLVYMDIQPSVGVEIVIHNIMHESDVELYIFDGTNNLKFDSEVGMGAWCGFFFHATNTIYYRVKNVSGVVQLIAYDGIQTK